MAAQDLVKLEIEGYEDPACLRRRGEKVLAFLNPSTYKRNYKTIYKQSEENGTNSPTQIFDRIADSDLNLSLFVDGTGIVKLGNYRDVDHYINTVKEIAHGFKGEIHRPYYLKVTWGSLNFVGICINLDITYSLFTPDGKALRATIDIVLSESTDYKTKAKEAAKSSPDLTHVRFVRDGDTLPLLTYQVYGDSSYYLFVAKKNNLDSVNDIEPGQRLYFYPLEQTT
jgi:nucleoid-associated protein YgaU